MSDLTPLRGGEPIDAMRRIVAENLGRILADDEIRTALERYAVGLPCDESYVRSAVAMLLCADALTREVTP